MSPFNKWKKPVLVNSKFDHVVNAAAPFSYLTDSAYCLVLYSDPIARQAKDRDIPPAMQQQLLDDALVQASKSGEANITSKHIESIAFDGKKNIFTPVKFSFKNHDLILTLPARNGGNQQRIFQVSPSCRQRVKEGKRNSTVY